MSLSDGMGSGRSASEDSEKVIELTQRLLDGIFGTIGAQIGKYGAFAGRHGAEPGNNRSMLYRSGDRCAGSDEAGRGADLYSGA